MRGIGSGDKGKGAHGEGAHRTHFDGDGEEAEASVGQLLEAAKVFDDGDAGAEKGCVHWPAAVFGVVDVEGVYANEGSAGFDEMMRGAGREKGVPLEIAVGAPVLVPAGVEEDGFAGDIEGFEGFRTDGAGGRGATDDDAFQIGEGGEVQLGEIVAAGEAVEGSVDVGASVGDHFNLAYLEGGISVVAAAGVFAAPVVGDDGGGQAAVGDHAVFDGVAEVDKGWFAHFSSQSERILYQLTPFPNSP